MIMNILAIVNNKGGVGKTTTAQHIGAAVATFTDSKTLLIDLDPQASLTKSLGARLQPSQPTIGSCLLDKATISQACIKYKNSNIDLLPASLDLLQDEESIKNRMDFPFTLKRILEKSQQPYDFVIIDCPPALSALTKIALTACHRYYVPLQAEYFSYEGLREFIHYANQITMLNPQIELGGVFATRFNPRTKKKFSKELIESVKKQLQGKFLKTYIRENIALSEAQAQGQHIFEYDRTAHGAQDYYNLTKEIILR